MIGVTEILDEEIVTLLYCNCKEGINSPDMLRAFQSSDVLEEVIQYTMENYEIQMDNEMCIRDRPCGNDRIRAEKQ